MYSHHTFKVYTHTQIINPDLTMVDLVYLSYYKVASNAKTDNCCLMFVLINETT